MQYVANVHVHIAPNARQTCTRGIGGSWPGRPGKAAVGRASWRLVAERSYKADNRAHLGDAVGVAGRSFPPPSRLPNPERKQRRRLNALHFYLAVGLS